MHFDDADTLCSEAQQPFLGRRSGLKFNYSSGMAIALQTYRKQKESHQPPINGSPSSSTDSELSTSPTDESTHHDVSSSATRVSSISPSASFLRHSPRIREDNANIDDAKNNIINLSDFNTPLKKSHDHGGMEKRRLIPDDLHAATDPAVRVPTSPKDSCRLDLLDDFSSRCSERAPEAQDSVIKGPQSELLSSESQILLAEVNFFSPCNRIKLFYDSFRCVF